MKRQVLIIIDDLGYRVMTNIMIERAGMIGVLAEDVPMALKMTHEHIPALIIVSMVQDESSAIEFIKTIKATDKFDNIPFLFIADDSLSAEAKIQLDKWDIQILAKPATGYDLIVPVRRILARLY